MNVSFLEYKSNSYCNLCFDERASLNPLVKSKLNTFDFMGDCFNLENENTKSTRPPVIASRKNFKRKSKVSA